MQDAVIADRASNVKGQPALKRLILANTVYSELKKKTIQESFLDKGGCQVLSEWIDIMPDSTFPNINLVEGVLHCIDSLQLDTEHLEQSKLGTVVQYYAEGLANIPQV